MTIQTRFKVALITAVLGLTLDTVLLILKFIPPDIWSSFGIGFALPPVLYIFGKTFENIMQAKYSSQNQDQSKNAE